MPDDLCSAHLLKESQTTQLRSVAEIAEVELSIDRALISVAFSSFVLYSYTYILLYVAKQNFKISTGMSEYPRSKRAISRFNNQKFSAPTPLRHFRLSGPNR